MEDDVAGIICQALPQSSQSCLLESLVPSRRSLSLILDRRRGRLRCQVRL